MKLGRSVRIHALALAGAALLAPACDTASDPDNGSTVDMVSHVGPMGDRDLEWKNGGDVPLEGMEHRGVAEVVSMTDSTSRLISERIVIGALGDRVLEASIDPVGFDAGDDQAVAFALFTRETPDDPWTSYSLSGTVGDFAVEAYTFRSIRIDRELNSIELEVSLPSPDGVWVDHFAKVIRLGEDAEVAIAPCPLAAWGNLEGTWEFELNVRCDGHVCSGE